MDRPSHESTDRESGPIRHIGVCLDRSPVADRVLPHAVALARAFGAKLTVLHVLEPPHTRQEAAPSDPLEWEFQRTEARSHLAAVEEEYSAADLVVGTEMLEGRPAEEIRDWVSRHGADLIVVSSHGASGWTEGGLASTARKLVERIGGGVFLVPAWSLQEPAKTAVTYARVLVPLDGSPRAESALPPALSLARAYGSELLLLHVVPRPEGSCPCPCEPEERDLEEHLVDRNARAAETYLQAVGSHFSGEPVRVRTRVTADDDVRGELLRRIAEDQVDLVVLSGHGRGGRAELPFGSVASFLLEHSTAPLLVVREPGDHMARFAPGSRSRSVRLPHLAAS